MFGSAWTLLKSAATGYIEDNALSRGAAIAYYTVTAIAPVLVIVIAIAGLVFGQDAAQGAIVAQLSGLMGKQSAEVLQSMIRSASDRGSGILATIIGVGTLLVTASGVFGEMQSTLNDIWKAEPAKGSTVSRLVKARMASLGLVMALGFLLMVSLVVSAALTALGDLLNNIFPGFSVLLKVLNFLLSFGLISVLFGLIYKVLPDKPITWRDVAIGAVATAFLFTVGKVLIGLYLGGSAVASSYGAAGAFLLVLLWIYYSSQIFLFGAEFTRAFAEQHGSQSDESSPAGGNPTGAVARVSAPISPLRAPEPTFVAIPATPRPGAGPRRFKVGATALAAAVGAASFGLGRLLARRMSASTPPDASA